MRLDRWYRLGVLVLLSAALAFSALGWSEAAAARADASAVRGCLTSLRLLPELESPYKWAPSLSIQSIPDEPGLFGPAYSRGVYAKGC